MALLELAEFLLRPNERYSLRGGEILRSTRWTHKVIDAIRVDDIAYWDDFCDPWIYSFPIMLSDGSHVEWFDNQAGELEGILREVAPDKREFRVE